MADPLARQPETRAALADPVYRDAFETYARGGSDALDDRQRAAISRARELTGTIAPGLPLPLTAEPEETTR